MKYEIEQLGFLYRVCECILRREVKVITLRAIKKKAP